MNILERAEERGIEITTEIKVIAEAQKLGIDTIAIYFDGGGDDGYIESIDYFPDRPEWKGTEEEFDSFVSFMDEEAAMHLAFNYAGGSWHNNAGGTGSLNLDVKSGHMTADAVIREEVFNEFSLLSELE